MRMYSSLSTDSRIIRIVAIVLVVLLAFSGVAGAKKAKKKDRKQYTVSEAVYKKITKAQEAMAGEMWDLAIEELSSLEKKADKGRMGDHERALTYQLLSAIAAAKEDYGGSISYKEKALTQDALPEATTLRVQYEVAQLHLALEEYPEAVKALVRWFRSTDERHAHAYYLLAVCYYQQSLFEKALKPAKRAVEKAEKPTEPWLQMLVALYLHDERYADAIPYVEVMVSNFPKKIYYSQLSALYTQLEQEEKSLAVMQLSYEQGFLTLDRELRRLGEMFLYHGMPYRAAQVVERAIEEEKVEADAKALELLANSWLVAQERERALDPLMRAAELAEKGDIYIRLGQVFLQREDYDLASDAIAKGIERGIKREGDAQLLLGICFYNQEKIVSARRSFRAARKFDDTKEPALLWIQMLDREAKRAAAAEAEAAANAS